MLDEPGSDRARPLSSYPTPGARRSRHFSHTPHGSPRWTATSAKGRHPSRPRLKRSPTLVRPPPSIDFALIENRPTGRVAPARLGVPIPSSSQETRGSEDEAVTTHCRAFATKRGRLSSPRAKEPSSAIPSPLPSGIMSRHLDVGSTQLHHVFGLRRPALKWPASLISKAPTASRWFTSLLESCCTR